MADRSQGTERVTLNAEVLRKLRLDRQESQTKFWRRFGVTQSRGSRFEMGVEIPPSVAILVKLYLEGTISDGDLWRARRNGKASKQPATLGQQVSLD